MPDPFLQQNFCYLLDGNLAEVKALLAEQASLFSSMLCKVAVPLEGTSRVPPTVFPAADDQNSDRFPKAMPILSPAAVPEHPVELLSDESPVGTSATEGLVVATHASTSCVPPTRLPTTLPCAPRPVGGLWPAVWEKCRLVAKKREMTCDEFLAAVKCSQRRLPHRIPPPAPLLCLCDAPRELGGKLNVEPFEGMIPDSFIEGWVHSLAQEYGDFGDSRASSDFSSSASSAVPAFRRAR